MATKTAKKEAAQSGFSYALKSFIGYLEGTHKSIHTIKNYRLDLLAFETFLKQSQPANIGLCFEQVSQADVERYRNHLKGKGLKTNTRRRKLLTVTQFLSYLAKRKKISPEMARKAPAPHKIERIPYTVSYHSLIELIQQLPSETVLDARNRVLLWTLAETGCLVSEVTQLRFEDWIQAEDLTKVSVRIPGKFARTVPVSVPLYEAIEVLKARLENSRNSGTYLFLGYNKFGALGGPLSPRGVEMVVKFYGPKLGFPQLTPRTFRHSVILSWFEQGLPQNHIQDRLGLKTTYAFRSYMPLLNARNSAEGAEAHSRSNSGTTSIAEMTPPES